VKTTEFPSEKNQAQSSLERKDSPSVMNLLKVMERKMPIPEETLKWTSLLISQKKKKNHLIILTLQFPLSKPSLVKKALKFQMKSLKKVLTAQNMMEKPHQPLNLSQLAMRLKSSLETLANLKNTVRSMMERLLLRMSQAQREMTLKSLLDSLANLKNIVRSMMVMPPQRMSLAQWEMTLKSLLDFLVIPLRSQAATMNTDPS
jgi:hypothetical protein